MKSVSEVADSKRPSAKIGECQRIAESSSAVCYMCRYARSKWVPERVILQDRHVPSLKPLRNKRKALGDNNAQLSSLTCVVNARFFVELQ